MSPSSSAKARSAGSIAGMCFWEKKRGGGEGGGGTDRGAVLSGKLTGAVEGRRVTFRSAQRIEGTTLHYEFSGDVTGGRIEGVVKLGEYGQARFAAQRA